MGRGICLAALLGTVTTGFSCAQSSAPTLMIETLHFGAPGSPAENPTIETLTADPGRTLVLASDRYDRRYGLRITRATTDRIALAPVDAEAARLPLYVGAVADRNKGYSLESIAGPGWERTLARGQFMTLTIPGVADAGASWTLMLP